MCFKALLLCVCADAAVFLCVSVRQKVRLARIRMAKKGTANAFLQYKEDRSLEVRHTLTAGDRESRLQSG